MNPKSTEPEAPDFDELVKVVRLTIRFNRGIDKTDPCLTDSGVIDFIKKYTSWLLNYELSEPSLTKARQIVLAELDL